MPLRVLYDGKGADTKSDPQIDIVAIHGLNPFNNKYHAYDTWRKPSGENGHLWLKDALPISLPKARTMIYIYNSNPALNPTKERFVHEAEQFLANLSVKRFEDPKRPLMLVGHSLGGILIKQALTLAHADPAHKDIIESTFALVFMGTPHDGPTKNMKIEFGKMCAQIAKRLYGSPSTDLMEALENNSMFSAVLEANWRHQLEKYQIISCYEDINPIVPRESAVLGLQGGRETILRMEADHSDVCRFDPTKEVDRDNLELLEVNLRRVCRAALKEESKPNIAAGLFQIAGRGNTISETTASDIYPYAVLPFLTDRRDYTECKGHMAMPESLNSDILASLRGFSSNPRYAKIENEHTDTLDWIWTTKEDGGPGYLNWLRSDEGLFWISGKPGAGKSTLMKFIHDHDQTKALNAVLISFFFHDLGIPSERTFTGLLHALLFQLLSKVPELSSHIQPRFQNLKTRSIQSTAGESIWTETELKMAFADILTCNPASDMLILCIIDGLDECEERDLPDALEFLNKMITSNADPALRFKILCSSRTHNPIEIAFSRHPTIKIHDWTARDIEKFVTARFSSLTKNLHPFDEGVEIGKNLVLEVVRKAEGVFMWARLVVPELLLALEAGNTNILDEKLKQLPSDLEELYTRIIEKVPLSSRHHIFNYTQCLLGLDDFDVKPPDTLLGLTFATQPSKYAFNERGRELTVEQKIRNCIGMKKQLQDKCRGFIDLPSLIGKVDQDKLLENFCRAPVYIHKTVRDHLFASDKSEKLRSGIDAELLEGKHTQLAAFYFRLLRVDPLTREQALPQDPDPLATILLSSSEQRCMSSFQSITAWI